MVYRRFRIKSQLGRSRHENIRRIDRDGRGIFASRLPLGIQKSLEIARRFLSLSGQINVDAGHTAGIYGRTVVATAVLPGRYLKQTGIFNRYIGRVRQADPVSACLDVRLIVGQIYPAVIRPQDSAFHIKNG